MKIIKQRRTFQCMKLLECFYIVNFYHPKQQKSRGEVIATISKKKKNQGDLNSILKILIKKVKGEKNIYLIEFEIHFSPQ